MRLGKDGFQGGSKVRFIVTVGGGLDFGGGEPALRQLTTDGEGKGDQYVTSFLRVPHWCLRWGGVDGCLSTPMATLEREIHWGEK